MYSKVISNIQRFKASVFIKKNVGSFKGKGLSKSLTVSLIKR